MVEGPLQEPSGGFPQTSVIADSANLPLIFSPTPLHAGLLIALAALIVVWLLLLKTSFGFRIRVVGANAQAARVAGMSIERTFLLAMTLSGGLAGLAGFVEISGVQHRLLEGFSPGYGFDGIAIGLLARGHVLAVAPAAMLFAILAVGANALQRAYGVPAPLVVLIQGLIILFVIYGDHARAVLHRLWRQTGSHSYKVRVMR
jgi:simple sugar transport system permease protein